MDFEKSVNVVLMLMLIRICAAAKIERENVKNAYCERNVTVKSLAPVLAAPNISSLVESWKLVEICCEGYYRTASNSCEPVYVNEAATEKLLIENLGLDCDYWHIFAIFAIGVTLLVIALALLYCIFCSKGGVFRIPSPPPDYNCEEERRRLYNELLSD